MERLEDRLLLANWSGDLVGNTVWPPPGETIADVQRIVGTVRIPAGSTLTVNPGTVVKFNDFSGFSLIIEGTLTADGTSGQPIVFTALADDTGLDGMLGTGDDQDTNGGGPSNGVDGSWNTIDFRSSSANSVFDNVHVRFGGDTGFGVITSVLVQSSSTSITNSIIRDSESAGLRIVGSNPTLSGVTFSGNTGAAATMDLASNPAITGVTMSSNPVNALVVDAGTLTGSRTWDDPAIVYRLNGDVTVAGGATLTVGAGQVVKTRSFAGDDIIVNGTLVADGTPAQPIIFTPDNDDTAGGDTDNNGPTGNFAGTRGGFNSIQFNASSTGNLFDNVEVRYGGDTGFGSTAAVVVNGGPLTFTNSVVRDSESAGVQMLGASPTLTNITYQNNAGAAVRMDLTSSPAISGVTMTNNGLNALAVDPGTLTGSRAWDDPNIVYRISGDVTVDVGATLTIAAGQVVKTRSFAGDDIFVNGTLVADGLPGTPILFTSDNDDSAGGDTDNNGATGNFAGTRGGFNSIQFNASSTGNLLDNVEVRYGGDTGFGTTAAVFVNGGPLTFTNSIVRDSESAGVRMAGASPTLTNITYQNNVGPAARMDLASTPVISGVTLTNNGLNGLAVDPGTLTGNRVWNDPDIVYRISGDVTVDSGATLTIAAGQIVKLRSFAGDDIIVNGTFVADGTAASPVIFTSDNDDTAGGDTDNNTATGNFPGTRGGWNAITFNASSTGNNLDNVELRYGGDTGFGTIAAVFVNGGPLTLSNSLVRDSETTGVRIAGSNPMLTGNVFQNNSGAALSMNLASNPTISGVTLSGNGSNSIVVDSGSLPANGFWDDPDIVYRLNGDVTVPAGLTLTVAAGQIVKARSFAGDDIIVDGTLTANGEPTERIIFTSDNDDTAGGDTDNNGPTGNFAGSRGSWNGIQFSASSTDSLLDNVEVRFAGDTGFGTVAAVVVSGGELTLTDSTIRHSESAGVRIAGSSPTITGDAFSDNLGAALSMDLASDPAVSGVTFTNNGLNGLNVDGGSLAAAAVWNDPDVVYRLFADVTVGAGTSLTIGAGQIVKFRSFAGVDLIVNGTLTADATLNKPLLFTSDNDDSAGGDTDNNGPTGNFANTRGGWNAIRFTAGSTGNVLDHAEIRFGGDTGFGTPAAVLADGGSATVTNSVIRESESHALAARSSGSLTASNNLIFRNSDTGLRAESSATLTATNNTIDANLRGAAADGSGTTLTLTNNLITNNTRSGVFASGGATVNGSFNDVFNPGAAGGDYEGLASQTGTNSNTSVDPKYFNRTNAQYQLRAGSSAIDSATGTGATATDFFGNPRFDDPNILNFGAASPPFVDRGAIERQEVSTSDIDLATVAVSGPTSGMQDESVTVNWTVRNVGTGPAVGSWFDAVYLSVDSIWTPDDVLLGEKKHDGDLGPNLEYSNSTSVTLPGSLPGDYYFIVRADTRNEVFEALAEVNNAGASAETLDLDLPSLFFGTATPGTLAATGSAKFYKIAAPAGADMAVNLIGPAGATNELYLKFGDLPSRQSFDERGIRLDSANQTVSVSDTQAGNYFVEVFAANLTGAETITITATLAGFGITGVTPTRGSNTGEVTIAIAGSQFDGDSQPRLIDSAGGTISPTAVFFTDSGLVSATFNVTGRPTGLADVQIVNGGGPTTTLLDGFNIVAGQSGRLVTNLVAPSRVRLGRNFQVIVQYSNAGDTDLSAPIMHLAGMGFSELSLSADLSDAAARLDLVGASSSGPAGILAPGSQNQIVVYGRATATGDERFALSVDQNPNDPLDWAAIKPTLRPPGISDADFDAIFDEVRQIIGDNFADLNQAISDATTLLPPSMGNNRSLNDVFGLILRRAIGNLTTSVRGTLFLADTEHPLRSVRVELVEAIEDPQVIVETISLNDGSFLVSQVPAGMYDVNFDGFVSDQPVFLTVAAGGLDGLSLVLETAGLIEGSVILVPGGVPLRNVLVTAASSTGNHFTTITRADGSYRIAGVAPDVYTVHGGGGQYTVSQVEGVDTASSSVVRHVNLSVQFAGGMSGKVTGPAGGVEDAEVTAFGVDGRVFTATTDVAGDYTLTALPGQSYTVTAFAAGLFAGDAIINLAAGEMRTGVNLVLASAGGITGSTTSLADGTPLAAVFLEAVRNGNSFTAQSDENGDYSISDLPPGNYIVTAFGTELMTTTVAATVTAGATQNVEILVAELGSVSGTVRASGSGIPLANLTVTARDASGEQASDLTDDAGEYELTGLDAGPYSIVVGRAGSPGGADAAVTLTPATPTAVADFSIVIATTVSGTVLAADGLTPVAFATVGLTQGAAPIATAISDVQGEYRFLVFAAGNYQLEASVTGRAYSPLAITLSNGANLTDRNLTAGTVEIAGTVRDAMSGLPIASASVDISQLGPGTWSHFVAGGTTDAAGHFSFSHAAPGTYSLLVRAAQHAAAQGTVAISASGITNLVFDLPAETGLQGTIRDAATGQGLPGVLLLLVRDDNELLRDRVTSDEMGGYAFDGLAPGSYSLVVRTDEHQTVFIENLNIGAAAAQRDVGLNGPGITVTGAVQNSSGVSGGVLVTATNERGLVVAQTNPANDGTYTFSTLPPGMHKLTATGEGYTPSPPVVISVSQGQALTNVNLNLTATALAESFEVTAPPDDPALRSARNGPAATWLNELGKQLVAASLAQKLVPSLSRIELLIASAEEPCLGKYGDDARYAVQSAHREFFDLKSKFTLATRVTKDFTGVISDLTRAPRTVDNLSNQFPEILTLVTRYLGTSSDDTFFSANATPVLTTGELANFTQQFSGLDISKENPGPGLSQALARIQNGINTAKERVARGDFSGAQRTITSLKNAIDLFRGLFQRWGDHLKFKGTNISEGDTDSDQGDLAKLQNLVLSGGLGPSSLADLKTAIDKPELGKLINAVEDFRQQRLTYFRAHARALAKTLGLLKCTPPPKPKSPPAPPDPCDTTTGGAPRIAPQVLRIHTGSHTLSADPPSLNLLRPG